MKHDYRYAHAHRRRQFPSSQSVCIDAGVSAQCRLLKYQISDSTKGLQLGIVLFSLGRDQLSYTRGLSCSVGELLMGKHVPAVHSNPVLVLKLMRMVPEMCFNLDQTNHLLL